MDKQYKELDEWLNTLEQCVERLLEHKERGELVKYCFNGHWLYSDTVTMDNAYLEVVGQTKAEFDQYCEDFLKKNIQDNVESWIKKGRELFPKPLWDLWDKTVPIRATDIYQGMELDELLAIQQILLEEPEDTRFEQARAIIIESNHSNLSYGLMMDLIETFCTSGIAFSEWMKAIEEPTIDSPLMR